MVQVSHINEESAAVKLMLHHYLPGSENIKRKILNH